MKSARVALSFVLAVLASCFGGVALATAEQGAPRPHIVYILAWNFFDLKSIFWRIELELLEATLSIPSKAMIVSNDQLLRSDLFHQNICDKVL